MANTYDAVQTIIRESELTLRDWKAGARMRELSKKPKAKLQEMFPDIRGFTSAPQIVAEVLRREGHLKT